MEAEFGMTVEEALRHPVFERAELIAGKNGLKRKIRWIHIVEVTDFFIHGEEMLLTTGVGVRENRKAQIAFLQNMIDCGATCLCVELGDYVPVIDEEWRNLAERHSFPLIVFHEKVRFVDITQQLHSEIINKHHMMLEKLESVSREMHRLTLGSQGSVQIYRLLQSSTGFKIYYIPEYSGTVYPTGPAESEAIGKIRSYLTEWSQKQKGESALHWNRETVSYMACPVGALDQIWGYIVLSAQEREPGEFDALLLDRAAIALSQDLLRKKYIEERKFHSEQAWIDDLIHHRISDEQLVHFLGLESLPRPLSYTISLLQFSGNNHSQMNDTAEWETALLETALICRSSLEKHGFRTAITPKSNRLILLAIDMYRDGGSKQRLRAVFKQIGQGAGGIPFRAAASSVYSDFNEARQAYSEAIHVLQIQPGLTQEDGCSFYEDLGVRRLFVPEQKAFLNKFVDDYIGPLIKVDSQYGSQLLHTLTVFLEQGGSKMLTADALFIVRQTLYYRLEKIKKLLGEDYMTPERKLAIEVAIRAHQYLGIAL